MKPNFKSKVSKTDLASINKKVHDAGTVDRQHLLEFLSVIPDNDGQHIVEEVKNWLYTLHNDPHFETVLFPQGHIEAVLSDLDSYGRVQSETILKFKQENGRQLPIS